MKYWRNNKPAFAVPLSPEFSFALSSALPEYLKILAPCVTSERAFLFKATSILRQRLFTLVFLIQENHPPLFVDVRRSSNFCEMVVNFYAVSSKRGRFTKAPSLKTS